MLLPAQGLQNLAGMLPIGWFAQDLALTFNYRITSDHNRLDGPG
jgi:hypothetical protein